MFHLSDNTGLTKVPVTPHGDSGSLTRFQRFYIHVSKKSSLWLVGFGTYFPPFRSSGLWGPSEGSSDSCLCLSVATGGPRGGHQSAQHGPILSLPPQRFILICA